MPVPKRRCAVGTHPVGGLGKVRHREFAMASGEMSPAEFERFLKEAFTLLATFRRKIGVFGSTVNGFGRAKTAGLPAVIFEGLW
jgi:hypothetical protein